MIETQYTSRFLYNSDPKQDEAHILAVLEGLGKEFGKIEINTIELASLCTQIKTDFPHRGGVENASVFKKMANFILWFVQNKPITAIPLEMENVFTDDLRKIHNYKNILIGLWIALDGMHEASLLRSDGEEVTIQYSMELSQHSIVDIVEAISSVSPSTGFKMLTVLLEQIAYKTNGHCQYGTFKIP
jgi:hypothetical protein